MIRRARVFMPALPRTALLQLQDATLGHRARTVLDGVNLTLERGAFLGVVGPNGSGKTTLLRAALGLLRPLRGRVVRAPRLRVGYVPQRSGLDPLFPVRVREMVMMGRYPHLGLLRRPRPADHRAVEQACEHTGILGLLDHPLRDLSGGQQQRALLARALAVEPELLVLDEPTNGMDIAAERALVDQVVALWRTRGCTVVFVTHLLHLVANAAPDVALIHRGRVHCGPRRQMLTASNLSDLYRTPIDVHEVEGRLLILARGSGV